MATITSSNSSTNPLQILLLGDCATGKQCYLKRLTHNTFASDTRTNKEYDIISANMAVDDRTMIPIQFFNVSGSQCGKAKLKNTLINIVAYIVMFDVTRAETYDNVIKWKNWIQAESKLDNVPSLLLANKCDLEQDPELDMIMSNLETYRESLGFTFSFMTSNKNNLNINESIQALIREIIKRSLSSVTTENASISLLPNRTISYETKKQEYKLKILVIGEIGTGKSAFIQRYVNNTFTNTYRSTIGTDIAVKKIQYTTRATVNLHIWDIAGDERFGLMTRLFYKDASGCFVVYDVSKPQTLVNGAVKWKIDFDNKVNVDTDKTVPCVLIGNKCDLEKEGIAASEPDIREFCQRHGFTGHFPTSARENINIIEAMLFLIDEIMKTMDGSNDISRRHSQTIQITEHTPSKRSFNRCCNK